MSRMMRAYVRDVCIIIRRADDATHRGTHTFEQATGARATARDARAPTPRRVAHGFALLPLGPIVVS